jgi:hypothetical protein
MSGGGPSGSATSTTTTSLPPWEQKYAKQYLHGIEGQVMPNGQLAPYNPALNQNVAPFTDYQNAALGLGGSLTQGAQGFANLGAGQNALYASGAMLSPSSNPYLADYYNAAAGPLVENYQQATQPALQAQAEQAGVLNSSGFSQSQGNAQYNLGQGLATLGANIYEPAFQLGTQEQMAAIQNTPAAVQGLYEPTQALYGLGSAQQQQQQNVNNAATQNAQQATNWPFNLLSSLGSALGIASGGGGQTISTGPAPGGGLFGK